MPLGPRGPGEKTPLRGVELPLPVGVRPGLERALPPPPAAAVAAAAARGGGGEDRSEGMAYGLGWIEEGDLKR